LQIVCGSEPNAYNGVKMLRTTALLNNKDFEFPIIIDISALILTVYTLTICPFITKGHMVSTDFNYRKSVTELKTLGTSNGYQHLWLEASGKTNKQNANLHG